MGSGRGKPLDFRSRDVSQILGRLFAGDSRAVVGVGSVGKSNLLRHLLRTDVQKYHVQQMGLEPGKADLLTMILIDPNNMLDALPHRYGFEGRLAWAGYEIMMHRLYKAFYPFRGLEPEEQRAFGDAYQELRDGNNLILANIAPRYLEAALEILLNPESNVRKNRQIVFVFDEFEEMLTNLPAKFFKTLRGLRDDYKYRLMYLTFTRKPLLQILEENDLDYLEFEPFIELFTDNTHFLGPYDEPDARAMLEQLTGRHSKQYSQQFRHFLLRVTGGYAGLLRACFLLAEQMPRFSISEGEAIEFLVNSPAVDIECRTIWKSLSKEEKAALKSIAANQVDDAPAGAINLLSAKKLLSTEGTTQIEPPLFREFVRRDGLTGGSLED